MMSPQALASALLVGTSLGEFSYAQRSFTLRFSRWSHVASLGHKLPFEVQLDALGSVALLGPAPWGAPQTPQPDEDEALLAAGLVRLCQSGDGAFVADVLIAGPALKIKFMCGATLIVDVYPANMGPDWVLAERPPGLPGDIRWSVSCEGGRVDSKRP